MCSVCDAFKCGASWWNNEWKGSSVWFLASLYLKRMFAKRYILKWTKIHKTVLNFWHVWTVKFCNSFSSYFPCVKNRIIPNGPEKKRNKNFFLSRERINNKNRLKFHCSVHNIFRFGYLNLRRIYRNKQNEHGQSVYNFCALCGIFHCDYEIVFWKILNSMFISTLRKCLLNSANHKVWWLIGMLIFTQVVRSYLITNRIEIFFIVSLVADCIKKRVDLKQVTIKFLRARALYEIPFKQPELFNYCILSATWYVLLVNKKKKKLL